MQSTRVGVLALTALAVPGSCATTSVAEHPIQRVIGLLQKLSLKAEEEGKTEALAYDKFVHWCSTSTKTLDNAISEERDTITELESQVDGEEKTIKLLDGQIEKLAAQIEELGQAATAAEKERTEANELYVKSLADYKATVQAIASAIDELKKSMGAASLEQVLAKPALRQALALAAVDGESLSEPQRGTLAALLQQRPDLKAKGDRAAHVKPYNFKSGNVIELLKELQRKFEDEQLETEKGETNAQNAYNLEKQARDAAKAAAEKSKEQKTTTRGDTEESLVQHKKDLEDTQGELKADSGSLAETQKACGMKAQEWEERSQVRSKEIEAMGVAVKILAKASGVRSQVAVNPALPPAPSEAEGAASFLQISDPLAEALSLLKSRASRSHSSALKRLAQELQAHAADPFSDMNNMIEKMIFRLQSEQTDEDKHKMWCDQELSKTNTSKANKEDKVDDLTSSINSLDAQVKQLTLDVKNANGFVAKQQAFMTEAAEIRAIGKEENAAALKDAQDAQTAIADATAVLTSFYKESGSVAKESWEFLQRGVDLPANPSTWDSSYTGVSDPKKQPEGIITVLEKVGSEFAAMEADTRAQEASDEKAFNDQMKESKIDVAERTKEAEMKETEKKRALQKLATEKTMLKRKQGELESVEQYLKDLAPACLEGDSSYEARKAARTDEIEALREAEKILMAYSSGKSTGTKFMAVRRH